MYLKLIEDFTRNRLVIISSNVPVEYSFCQTVIDMKALKSIRV
jgi:hypothetical protein